MIINANNRTREWKVLFQDLSFDEIDKLAEEPELLQNWIEFYTNVYPVVEKVMRHRRYKNLTEIHRLQLLIVALVHSFNFEEIEIEQK